ncbi:putative pentatricopeptide repeat-containing protein At1g77010, mitochondrial [Selaginella moellendorffii]|uniref:putative pentatricopeptide repeat-containing protein At1g77010, mitochondrial n=1 Tax=Selaginella moellendorffii TaxID=88036 RepID=UPI000D1CB165|nr:putative pentatricopeptide repeat-containing protein At1g77010, mitochondrial [Selaginella moellendorffii]|eukprot:XP_024522347.1 putative pentatricopeptide repeat-containing protein At1g77010, mitochondrial [Selaginella moellendorffii]
MASSPRPWSAWNLRARDCGGNGSRKVDGAMVPRSSSELWLSMCSTCCGRLGSLADARSVFEGIENPDLVSWNAMIQNFPEEQALPDSHTFVAAWLRLQRFRGKLLDRHVLELREYGRCAQGVPGDSSQRRRLVDVSGARRRDPEEATVQKAMALHSQAHAGSHGANIFIIITSLVDLYANCGSMVDAHRVFDAVDKLQRTSLALWNALLLENGDPELVLEWFPKMELELLRNQLRRPDSRSFACAFKACGGAVALSTGKASHARVCRLGLDFYAKCGSLADAPQVLRLPDLRKQLDYHLDSVDGRLQQERRRYSGARALPRDGGRRDRAELSHAPLHLATTPVGSRRSRSSSRQCGPSIGSEHLSMMYEVAVTPENKPSSGLEAKSKALVLASLLEEARKKAIRKSTLSPVSTWMHTSATWNALGASVEQLSQR